MTIFKHEWRLNRTAFLIWTVVISFMIGICIFLYPEIKGEMESISDVFADMGSFTAAFGMDQVNFGTLVGYYSIECGNVLGLGGAFFAALYGAAAIVKEEKERTADFLLTHPIRRTRILTEKLLALLSQIVLLNSIVFAVVAGSMAAVGEIIPWKEMLLLHVAYLFLQLELACICFGVSAFLRRGGMGIGIGVAISMYFLNLISNITESAEFLRYITPFGYTNGSEIVTNLELDWTLILLGFGYAMVVLIFAYLRYRKKDIV